MICHAVYLSSMEARHSWKTSARKVGAGSAQAVGLLGEFLVETKAGAFQTFAAAGIASEPVTGELEEAGKFRIAGLGYSYHLPTRGCDRRHSHLRRLSGAN